MCVYVRASDLVCVYGYVERAFAGVFVYGYVCAIGGICQGLAWYPCCFTSLLLSLILFWSRCHIAPPILTRARVHAGNMLRDEGAKALVPVLQAMTGLQSLDLYSTLPPPTPGDIVCVSAYAFGRGLTVGVGYIRVIM